MEPQLSCSLAGMSGYYLCLIGKTRGDPAASTLRFYELSGQSWEINARLGLGEATFNGFLLTSPLVKSVTVDQHCTVCIDHPFLCVPFQNIPKDRQEEYTCSVQINSVKSLVLTVEDASHLYSYCFVCSYVNNLGSGTRAFSLNSATVIRQLRVPLLVEFPFPL